MNSIYLVDSEKGGVGKSIFCRCLLQYLIDREVPFKFVEADLSNQDVLNIYSDVDADTAELTLDSRKRREADKIFEYAMEKDVVVNFPANVAIAFDKWLASTGALDMQKTEGIRFVKFFLLTQNPSSVDSLKRSLKKWGDRMQHVVIKNLHFAPEEVYEDLLDSAEIKSLLQKCKAPVISLDELDESLRDKIDEEGWRWDEAREEVFTLDQQRLKNWLQGGMNRTGIYGQLDAIKVIPRAVEASGKETAAPASAKK